MVVFVLCEIHMDCMSGPYIKHVHMPNLSFLFSMAAMVPLAWNTICYHPFQLRIHGRPEDLASELPQHHVVPEVGLMRDLLDVFPGCLWYHDLRVVPEVIV